MTKLDLSVIAKSRSRTTLQRTEAGTTWLRAAFRDPDADRVVTAIFRVNIWYRHQHRKETVATALNIGKVSIDNRYTAG